MTFPNDSDGDVLRRLSNSKFDFSVTTAVDFIIDFDHWPLLDCEMSLILEKYSNAEAIDPEDKGSYGYVLFQIHGLVTYEFVTGIQNDATQLARSIGGRCSDWGVLH